MIVKYLVSAFVLGVIVAIPPGSVTVIACQRAIQYGFRNSLVFTIGSSLTDIFYICLVYFGLTGFISDPRYKLLLWSVCGVLLVLIGVTTVASAGKNGEPGQTGAVMHQSRPWVTFVSGIAVTLTNPMTIIGWIAIAGNFFMIWKDRVPGSALFVTASIAVIMAGVLAWFVPLIYAASRLHRIMGGKFRKYLIVFAGLCLIVFGAISLVSAYKLV
jgi:threonine/homoserine/homoserine lactone efflux protein